MTFQFSQSSQPARLFMPLAKFSYADVHAGSVGPIPWTHLSSQGDLFVIINSVEITNTTGAIEKNYTFKVLQDPNIREEIDLSLLASAAQQAIHEVQRSGVPGQQPFITIIVKNPCIAMRYPLQGGQVRRFQVRFTNDEDFYETLKVFARLKMPFVEAGTTSNQSHPVVSNNQYAVSGTTDHASRTHSNAANTVSNESCFTAFPSRQPTFPRFAASQQKPPAMPVPALSLSTNNVEDRPSIVDGHNSCASHSLPVPSISTYVPRPLTAPVVVTQQGNLDLPPKRDLPFERKAKQPASSAPQVQRDLPDTAQTMSISTAEAEVVNTIEPTNIKEGNGPKSKKRAPAKAKKAAAAKKPKTVTACKKSSIADPQGNTFEHDVVTQPLHTNDQSQDSHNSRSQLDTQALLDKAELIQASRKARTRSTQGKIAEYRNTRSRTGNQTPASQPAAITSGPAASTAGHNVPILEQTSLVCDEQRAPYHNQNNKNTSTDVASHSNLAIQSGLQPQIENPPSAIPNAPQPQPQMQTSASAQPIQPPLQPFSNLAVLLSDPDFAQPAIETLHSTSLSFDTLPESERHVLMESWMVQNFDDTKFISLCRTLECVWQRVFVRP